MDRRSYGRGRPRSSYRPRNLSSGNRSSNVGAQNPNPNYRSSNFDTSVDGNHVGGEGGGDGYRSSLVSGNSQRDELDDGQRPGNLVGTCTLMCPVRERAQRERLRDLSVFERLNGDPTKSSPSLAVKKFCRTISTNEASDLRPLSVLEDTLKYLLSLVDNSDHPFELVHDFVFDRIRSIRQDLSIQNLDNIRAIHMYEEMIRVEVNVLHGPSAKKVALAAAKDLGATWVILDRQMKKDKRYFMEELPTCKISRLKRDNTMEELRGAKLSGETALQRSIAKNVSYGEMIPGTPNDSPDRVTAAVELGMSRNVSYGEKVPGTPDDDPPESWRLWVGEGS